MSDPPRSNREDCLLRKTIRSAYLWHAWSTHGNARPLLGPRAAALAVLEPGEIAVLDREGRILEVHTSRDGILWRAWPCLEREPLPPQQARLVLAF
jgi:hypothetical protein